MNFACWWSCARISLCLKRGWKNYFNHQQSFKILWLYQASFWQHCKRGQVCERVLITFPSFRNCARREVCQLPLSYFDTANQTSNLDVILKKFTLHPSVPECFNVTSNKCLYTTSYSHWSKCKCVCMWCDWEQAEYYSWWFISSEKHSWLLSQCLGVSG